MSSGFMSDGLGVFVSLESFRRPDAPRFSRGRGCGCAGCALRAGALRAGPPDTGPGPRGGCGRRGDRLHGARQHVPPVPGRELGGWSALRGLRGDVRHPSSGVVARRVRRRRCTPVVAPCLCPTGRSTATSRPRGPRPTTNSAPWFGVWQPSSRSRPRRCCWCDAVLAVRSRPGCDVPTIAIDPQLSGHA